MNWYGSINTAMTALLFCLPIAAQDNLLASADRWIVTGEDSEFVTEYGESVLELRGGASLNDFEFQDGRISFEVRLTHRSAFVGMQFRATDGGAEHIYVRPHRSSEWDAVQYQPIMNGSSTWQIHRGNGYTTAAALPHDEWISVRLDVQDARAALFVGDATQPTMLIALERGITRGGIGFTSGFRDPAPAGEVPGSFRRLILHDLSADVHGRERAAPTDEDPYVRTWHVSAPFPMTSLPASHLPDTVSTWTTVQAERRGLVNLNRHFARVQGAEYTAVIARKTIESDHDTIIPFEIDFSDHVSVFLNRTLLFNGTNSWESRYPYYLGVLHPETVLNTVWLQLRRGENDLALVVSEAAFGWGFVARVGDVPGVEWR